MTYYAGITIGPIFDTISNATIPAALWFASYLFSDLSRRICGGIREGVSRISGGEGVSEIPGAVIISPYHDGANDNDGVGKYHDRIIFHTDQFDDRPELDKRLKDVIRAVIARTGDAFETVR